ncbi:MAG: electron transfer flavoprotein subunit alpha [Balneola sp.]|nr:electron transfer flavoprotein subunit alpha [Balneola sp.]
MILSHLLTIHKDGINRASAEILARCRELKNHLLKNSINTELHAIICNSNVSLWNSSKLSNELGIYGVDKIWITKKGNICDQNKALIKYIASAQKEATKKYNIPSLLVMESNELVKDILGGLAIHINASVISDVIKFGFSDNNFTPRKDKSLYIRATRPVMTSKALADVKVIDKQIIISLRPGSYNLPDVNDLETVPKKVEIEYMNDRLHSPNNKISLKNQIKQVINATEDFIDLNEARIIVAAGRGIKDQNGKTLIANLAEVLNAGIAASRALTQSGIYDSSVLVGQSGKVVSPQLYLAVGISGSVQHISGILNSKMIIAINKDKNAPIFDIADYGIVGDLNKVIPILIDEIKKIKSK